MRFIQTLDSKDPCFGRWRARWSAGSQGNLAAALFLLGSILFAVDGMVYLSTAINVNYVLYSRFLPFRGGKRRDAHTKESIRLLQLLSLLAWRGGNGHFEGERTDVF